MVQVIMQTATSLNDDSAATDVTESSLTLACAQVYGGTGATSRRLELPGLEGFLYSRPCQSETGGDIHYLSKCGSGLLTRFCLADVAGHGREVSLVSAEAHGLLRRSVDWTDHRRTLRLLNRSLSDRRLGSFVTAAVFSYLPGTRVLTYSYAGHPRAWHWSASRGEWSRMELTSNTGDEPAGPVSDLPLAVAPDTMYSRVRLRPDIGDMIVITTDGVTDALGPSGRTLGERGLRALLGSVEEESPRAVVAALVEGLEAHCGVREFTHDDVTILALRLRPFSPARAVQELVLNRFVRSITRRPRSEPSP
jgi:sigma-B regulation protein RsbU (phosphoserine phosphatase)